MIIRLLNYIFGYVYIEAAGEKKERFINLCIKRQVPVWKVKYTESGCSFYMYAKDFKLLKEIKRKTGIKIKIKERYGLPFFLFKYRKRKAFLFGIITAFVIVYIMSLFIWDISVDGNYTYTKYELIQFLKDNNVYHGMKKSDADCEEIEKLVRNNYFDITWVSVELTGTRLIVHVRENFDDTGETEGNQAEEIYKEDTGYMLISEKEAVIESIITRTGTPMVKAGDTVTEGTVLIDGKYDIVGDYDEYIRTEYVRADGDVYGYVIYEYSDNIDREYILREYTGNQRSYRRIRVNDSAADFCIRGIEYENYDKIETEEQLSIVGDFYIPIYIGKIICREYIAKKVEYSDEELYSAAEKRLSVFLENLSEKGIQIIENNVKIEINANEASASGQIKVIEKLGTLKEMPREEITNEEQTTAGST
ncbi:MAG: sporulation protein YqfD [Lachnospiraceae bacterium]